MMTEDETQQMAKLIQENGDYRRRESTIRQKETDVLSRESKVEKREAKAEKFWQRMRYQLAKEMMQQASVMMGDRKYDEDES
jgi:butyrate kinase